MRLSKGNRKVWSTKKKMLSGVKWSQRNNLFIISVLAEAERAADMLTRLLRETGRCGCGRRRRAWSLVEEGLRSVGKIMDLSGS